MIGLDEYKQLTVQQIDIILELINEEVERGFNKAMNDLEYHKKFHNKIIKDLSAIKYRLKYNKSLLKED